MNYFRPSKIVFYLLSILTFFFLGVIYVAITGAAKDQGLAGGAIVIGYGFMGAFIGLLISVILVRYLNNKSIIGANIAMLVIILGFILYFFLKFKEREKSKADRSELNPVRTEYLLAATKKNSPSVMEDQPPMGLGLNKPELLEN